MIPEIELIERLILAALIGGLIGIEREVHNRPAGLRTHVLVTLGSALIMLISIDGFFNLPGNRISGDPARLASQVVSGIGFLGAGTIMRNGTNINGLTTAASLWVSAGIGLAIGAGYYLGAIITAVIVLLTLMTLGILEKKILTKKYKTVNIILKDGPGIIGQIGILFGKYNISIKDIAITNNYEDEDEEGNIIQAKFLIKTPSSFALIEFQKEIYSIDGVLNTICTNE